MIFDSIPFFRKKYFQPRIESIPSHFSIHLVHLLEIVETEVADSTFFTYLGDIIFILRTIPTQNISTGTTMVLSVEETEGS
jgi:hypothetical protein